MLCCSPLGPTMMHLLLDGQPLRNQVRRGSPTPTLASVSVFLRALSHDDIPALARLLAAAEAVDRTSEHYNEADLVEEFANPDIEIGKDVVGAFDADELVGYFSVYPRETDGTHHRFHVEGTVDPARRGQGIGTLLVQAMIARADEVHRERHPEMPARLGLSGITHEHLAGGAAREPRVRARALELRHARDARRGRRTTAAAGGTRAAPVRRLVRRGDARRPQRGVPSTTRTSPRGPR